MGKENDPLSILFPPHEVIEWQKKQGLLIKRLCPSLSNKGKWAVFGEMIRLTKLFELEQEAKNYIEEIIGDKKKCWENKRYFSVKQL